MSEKNVEMMKKLLAQKKEQNNQKQNYTANKKIGSSHKGIQNQKTGGSNNKV